MLLEHRAESCKPNNDDWLDNLDHLLTKYYKTETRSAIRLKALNVLEQIISTNKILHEVSPNILSMFVSFSVSLQRCINQFLSETKPNLHII